MTYARIRNQQQKQALKPISFQAVNWQPQVRVKFTRDVTGWLDRSENVKWHFASGSVHMVDEQHAVEFITKGYCVGELPRFVSADEADEIRSVVTIIGLDAQQSANGG